jgi:hypothetical protein
VEIQNLIKQQEAELFQLSPRFRTRLEHLRGRLRHLTELDHSASIIPSSRYQQVRERVDLLEASLPMMDGAARTRREKEEEEAEITNTTQEDMDDQLNSLAEGRTGIGRVSTVTGNVGIVEAPVRASGDSMKQRFTPQLYQRLPHPLSGLIKELPVVEGTDVNCLYNFLLTVLKVRQVAQMNDSAMYKLTYSYCKGELLCKSQVLRRTCCPMQVTREPFIRASALWKRYGWFLFCFDCIVAASPVLVFSRAGSHVVACLWVHGSTGLLINVSSLESRLRGSDLCEAVWTVGGDWVRCMGTVLSGISPVCSSLGEGYGTFSSLLLGRDSVSGHW